MPDEETIKFVEGMLKLIKQYSKERGQSFDFETIKETPMGITIIVFYNEEKVSAHTIGKYNPLVIINVMTEIIGEMVGNLRAQIAKLTSWAG